MQVCYSAGPHALPPREVLGQYPGTFRTHMYSIQHFLHKIDQSARNTNMSLQTTQETSSQPADEERADASSMHIKSNLKANCKCACNDNSRMQLCMQEACDKCSSHMPNCLSSNCIAGALEEARSHGATKADGLSTAPCAHVFTASMGLRSHVCKACPAVEWIA